MAEGQGFEPWVGANPRWFSRPVLSTAQPPLHKEGEMIPENKFESIYKMWNLYNYLQSNEKKMKFWHFECFSTVLLIKLH